MGFLTHSPAGSLAPLIRHGVLCLLLVASLVADVRAQPALQGTEQGVKAAFLYRFCDYVEWPAQAFSGPTSPLNIGVLGADSVADELAQMVAGRAVGGRPVNVRKLRRGDSLSGLHVLFIGREVGTRLSQVIAEAKGERMLVVTDSDGALGQGSMINFVTIDDRVRFDVAPAAAERSDLRISSRLLSVARRVIPNPS
jgi:hypothetical protein